MMQHDDLEQRMRHECIRLGIEDPAAMLDALIGDPPWLYPGAAFLQVARSLPDGAGAAAFIRAFRHLRDGQAR